MRDRLKIARWLLTGILFIGTAESVLAQDSPAPGKPDQAAVSKAISE